MVHSSCLSSLDCQDCLTKNMDKRPPSLASWSWTDVGLVCSTPVYKCKTNKVFLLPVSCCWLISCCCLVHGTLFLPGFLRFPVCKVLSKPLHQPPCTCLHVISNQIILMCLEGVFLLHMALRYYLDVPTSEYSTKNMNVKRKMPGPERSGYYIHLLVVSFSHMV